MGLLADRATLGSASTRKVARARSAGSTSAVPPLSAPGAAMRSPGVKRRELTFEVVGKQPPPLPSK